MFSIIGNAKELIICKFLLDSFILIVFIQINWKVFFYNIIFNNYNQL